MVGLTMQQLEGWAKELEITHKDASDDALVLALCNKAYEEGLKSSINIVESYKVSVGNSAAGERAAEWTMENLREIREEIRELINDIKSAGRAELS